MTPRDATIHTLIATIGSPLLNMMQERLHEVDERLFGVYDVEFVQNRAVFGSVLINSRLIDRDEVKPENRDRVDTAMNSVLDECDLPLEVTVPAVQRALSRGSHEFFNFHYKEPEPYVHRYDDSKPRYKRR